MREIYFGDLRHKVIEYAREIEASRPEADSTAWFLLRYLRRIIRVTEPPSRPGQVEGAIRSLVRFYIDNIDEKSVQGQICINIHDLYRKILRDTWTQANKHG